MIKAKHMMILIISLLTVFALSACEIARVETRDISFSIQKEGEGFITPNEGIYTYSTPTRITLEAEPINIDWIFVGWDGPVDHPTMNVTSIALTESVTVTALFEMLPENFDIALIVEGSGSIFPNTDVLTLERHEVTHVEAVAEVGWQFVRWEGDVEEPFNAITSLPANKAQEVKAIFEPISDVGLYENGDERINHIDLGLWLDGYEGTSINYTLNNRGALETMVDAYIEGDDAHLFEVTLESETIFGFSQMSLGVRYRGEVDPTSLGLKEATLILEVGNIKNSISLRATPIIDEVWALHALIDVEAETLIDLIERFETRTYPEAYLATGILNAHLFAINSGGNQRDIAFSAYEALVESDIDSDLKRVYEGVAASFIASELGAQGGAYIDLFQDILAPLDASSMSWFLNYWRGVTMVRTADGVLRDFFARLFYGNRANNIWLPNGRASLDVVYNFAIDNTMDELDIFDGFTYDREMMSVPYSIWVDVINAPRYTPPQT